MGDYTQMWRIPQNSSIRDVLYRGVPWPNMSIFVEIERPSAYYALSLNYEYRLLRA